MREVDLVFHAAALKQVPSCEFFPLEAVRTNVLGSANVVQAQRNAIHDNDNGVYVSGPVGTFDFSNGGQMVNRNQFYCNSKTLSGNGYDLLLATPSSGGALNFQGNQWDHAGPTTSVSLTTSANGTDYVTGTSGGANVANFGVAITTACATGRVH